MKTTYDAILSECGAYRYRLERRWGDGAPVVFVMLNPSTADATKDDPTIRRCIKYAHRWGADGLVVVNLFAWRATNPKELAEVAAPIGPGNDAHIARAVAEAKVIVAAWGAHGHLKGRGSSVRTMLGPGAKAFGFTLAGHPVHPLYQRQDAELVPLEWRAK